MGFKACGNDLPKNEIPITSSLPTFDHDYNGSCEEKVVRSVVKVVKEGYRGEGEG